LLAFTPIALVALGTHAGCGDDTSTDDGTPAGDKHVVILFTSDEHSHLLAFSPEIDDFPQATAAGSGALKGGVARRAAVLSKLRSDATAASKDVILVSAGDNQMGCLPHLAFESDSLDYQSMAALDYTATTFGNHEFDFGPGALEKSIKAAQAAGKIPPIVASNIHFSDSDPADDGLAALYSSDVNDDKPVHPYKVVTTASGVKIGLLGLVGINAAHVAPNKGPVRFSVPDGIDDADPQPNLHYLYEDLQPVVDKLKNDEKVDLVVALSHAGVRDMSSAESISQGEDPQICENVSGIDFIVSGHAHNHQPEPMERTNKTSGKKCLVLNAGSFGEEVGYVEFTIPGDKTKDVSWDTTTQRLEPVDDTTLPDTAFSPSQTDLIDKVEANPTLGELLDHAEGAPVTGGATGDLYFHVLANTDFDVTDTHTLNWLSADAMLAQSDALGLQTDLGLESAGVIRSTLQKGKTGDISAADAFNVVPLGRSPVDGTIGYPLIRGYVSQFELRAVAEFALAQGPTNSDFDLGFAGLKVEYDATRPAVTNVGDVLNPDKGQVMRLSLDTDHTDGFEQYDTVIYDRAAAIGDNTALVSFITSSYIGQFAGDAGVTIKDDTGAKLELVDAIVKRADTSEVKQVEAFMGFLKASPAGKLPATYDTKSSSFTKRFVCTKGC
jgi:5'-nucleotidase